MEAPGVVWRHLTCVALSPNDYTADPGPTLTMSGPKDRSRSADGMGGTRAVG